MGLLEIVEVARNFSVIIRVQPLVALALYFSSDFVACVVNVVKFNEYGSVVVSAGYHRSLRAWDCRSHSTEPIHVSFTFLHAYQFI
ncbi:hypothetical protein L1887_10993 [Cichorium endivia]|nr:hypothetical protein L1887_10993 [Cichorium endivia]